MRTKSKSRSKRATTGGILPQNEAPRTTLEARSKTKTTGSFSTSGQPLTSPDPDGEEPGHKKAKKRVAPDLGPVIPKGDFLEPCPRKMHKLEIFVRRVAENQVVDEALKAVARWTFGVASEIDLKIVVDSGTPDPLENSSREYPRLRPEIVDALCYGQDTSNDQRDPVARLSDRQTAVVNLSSLIFFLLRRSETGGDFEELGMTFIEEIADCCRNPDIIYFPSGVCSISPNDPVFVELLRSAHAIHISHATLIQGLRDVILEELSNEGRCYFKGRETWHLIERIQQILDDWEETRRLSEDGGVEEPVTSNAPVHVNSPSLQLRGAGY